MEEKPVLTEKDLHCMARLLQSLIFSEGDCENPTPIYGCMYCKYGMECQDPNGTFRETIRKKLEALTGVYLGVQIHMPIEKNFLPQSFQELYPEEWERMLRERQR